MISLMLKKLAAVSAGFAYFSQTVLTLAQAQPGVGTPQNINIQPPSRGGYSDLGQFITAALNLAFIVAAIAVLIMLVWGALQWIFSGGEKDAVAAARNRILHALIGLAVLAVAFAVAVVFGRFVGINLFSLVIPTPTQFNPGFIPPP